MSQDLLNNYFAAVAAQHEAADATNTALEALRATLTESKIIAGPDGKKYQVRRRNGKLFLCACSPRKAKLLEVTPVEN